MTTKVQPGFTCKLCGHFVPDLNDQSLLDLEQLEHLESRHGKTVGPDPLPEEYFDLADA